MDLLERIEGTIHRTVRMNNPEAAPPALDIKREGSNSVVINYTSKRNMLQFGVGIIKGIGTHYGNKLDIRRANYDDKQVLKVTKL